MKTVILAGGFGTRLAEETSLKPKPMVEIGGKPILVHIMQVYAAQGFDEFLVACGYKGEVIKEHFCNFNLRHRDWMIDLHANSMEPVSEVSHPWRVGVFDTGMETMTGGRVRRLRKWIGDDTFMVTYGDGLADVDLHALMACHRKNGRLATVTATHPPARFGCLEMAGDKVERFSEKPQASEGWINGGFFVFEPGVFDYLTDDGTILERAPLAQLAADGELTAYRHEGFWQPMDTLREKQYLESLWQSGKAPWAKLEKRGERWAA